MSTSNDYNDENTIIFGPPTEARCLQATLRRIDAPEPAPLPLVQAPDTSIFIRALSPYVSIRRNGMTLFVRYKIDADNELQSLRAKHTYITGLISRHPNTPMVMVAVKHRDRTLTVDAEYCDMHSLEMSMRLLGTSNSPRRVVVAKSVAVQVISALLYYDSIFGLSHGQIDPTSVLMRLDGNVKLKLFGTLTEVLVQLNERKFILSSYCAPENQTSVFTRVVGSTAGDIWAFGVLLYSILTGALLHDPYEMRWSIGAPTDVFRKEVPSHNIAHYNADRERFQTLLRGSDEEWNDAISDPVMRMIIRRCLVAQVEERASISEIAALLTYYYLPVADVVSDREELANVIGAPLKEALMITPTVDALTKIEELLCQEHHKWREGHMNREGRIAYDKSMHEVVRMRQKAVRAELAEELKQIRAKVMEDLKQIRALREQE